MNQKKKLNPNVGEQLHRYEIQIDQELMSINRESRYDSALGGERTREALISSQTACVRAALL